MEGGLPFVKKSGGGAVCLCLCAFAAINHINGDNSTNGRRGCLMSSVCHFQSHLSPQDVERKRRAWEKIFALLNFHTVTHLAKHHMKRACLVDFTSGLWGFATFELSNRHVSWSILWPLLVTCKTISLDGINRIAPGEAIHAEVS